MNALNKLYDLLLLCLGVVALWIVSDGTFEFEYGAWGYAAAYACIGIGAYRIVKMAVDAKAGKTLVKSLNADPKVEAFYHATQEAWSSGRLAYLDTRYQKEASLPYARFLHKYRPTPGGALPVFFREFPPVPEEYLVDTSDVAGEKGWYVLTNSRLVQKDGASGSFKAITLGEVDDVETKGAWARRMQVHLKGGESAAFDRVGAVPAVSDLEKVIAHAPGRC